MNRTCRIWTLAIVAMVFLSSIAACGGSSSSDLPVTPTAIYGGAATLGDLFVLKMDYPSTNSATIIKSATDGTIIGSSVLTYTHDEHNTYTFTNTEGREYTGLIVADTMLAAQVPIDEAGNIDLLIAVEVDTSITTAAQLSFLKDKNYLLTQFRHDEKGVKWVSTSIATDGAITGHHANNSGILPIDLDDTNTDNDFTDGMNLDNLVYNPETLGFTLTVDDQIWTLYYTPSGIGIIDRGTNKGIRFNAYKGTSSDPEDYGITQDAVYDMISYVPQGTGGTGTTSVGTATITEVGADYFIASVDQGRGDLPTVIRASVPTSANWLGFYGVSVGGIQMNAVIQPIGEDAFVLARNSATDWDYEYAVGAKRP